ncbi:MAG: CoA transferase [Alphaproteobacteria bacterium]|nr:CoA transferase [Alphaproteobacteria bacterium]
MPLEGLRVIDAASIFAGPLVASTLGDFGADVIKIEHPRGDALRGMGLRKNGIPLWWKVTSRNKRCITLSLSHPRGAEIFKRLVADADVLVENFRPGTMEKWGLGYEELAKINPRLIMVRVTGYGQTGPYRNRPGFGTIAEAFSGFAHITGFPDGPPTLPPFGLADGVAAYYGTFATMFAIYDRDVRGTGKGQVVDLSIYEPLFSLLGPQSINYDQLGVLQGRTGNRSVNNAPRDAYRTKDGRYVALSAAAPSVRMRVMRLCGGEAAANDPRFETTEGRIKHSDEINGIVARWVAERNLDQVLKAFAETEAAIGPVNDIAQIFADPQFQARNDIIALPDEDLGQVKMQNVFPFLSRTPGRVRWAGRRMGQDNDAVYRRELGLTRAEIAALKADGVI